MGVIRNTPPSSVLVVFNILSGSMHNLAIGVDEPIANVKLQLQVGPHNDHGIVDCRVVLKLPVNPRVAFTSQRHYCPLPHPSRFVK